MKEESFGKRLWRILYPLLTYNLISFVVSGAVTVVIMAALSQQFGVIDTQEAYYAFTEQVIEVSYAYSYEMQVLSALIAIPILVLFFRMDRKRRTQEGTWKRYDAVNPMLFGIALALGFAASYAANNLMLISGLQRVSGEYAELTEQFFKGNLVLELIGLGVIIPVAEEFIFRGLMYERMKEFTDYRWAAISVSVCFGAAHGNLVQGIFSFFLSLLMLYLCERYHSIWAPVLFHAASNMLAVIQSETKVLEFLFETPLMFYGSTLVMGITVIGLIALVERFVCSEEQAPQTVTEV